MYYALVLRSLNLGKTTELFREAAQLELGFKQQFEKSPTDRVGCAAQSKLKEDADQTSTEQERTETWVSNT